MSGHSGVLKIPSLVITKKKNAITQCNLILEEKPLVKEKGINCNMRAKPCSSTPHRPHNNLNQSFKTFNDATSQCYIITEPTKEICTVPKPVSKFTVAQYTQCCIIGSEIPKVRSNLLLNF